MTARCWASPSANPELKLGQNNHKKIVPGSREFFALILFVSIHLIKSKNLLYQSWRMYLMYKWVLPYPRCGLFATRNWQPGRNKRQRHGRASMLRYLKPIRVNQLTPSVKIIKFKLIPYRSLIQGVRCQRRWRFPPGTWRSVGKVSWLRGRHRTRWEQWQTQNRHSTNCFKSRKQ